MSGFKPSRKLELHLDTCPLAFMQRLHHRAAAKHGWTPPLRAALLSLLFSHREAQSDSFNHKQSWLRPRVFLLHSDFITALRLCTTRLDAAIAGSPTAQRLESLQDGWTGLVQARVRRHIIPHGNPHA